MFELVAASEEHLRDIGINPWGVGALAMTIFIGLVLGVLAFGKGREHS